MLIKLEYIIKELAIPEAKPLVFDLERQRVIEVVIRRPTQEEQSQGHEHTNAFCVASANFKSSKKNEEVFENIEKNNVWHSDSDFGCGLKYKDVTGLEITLPHLSGFPDHFQSFIRQAQVELSDAARSVVSILRWRCNIAGRHNPISSRGMWWSHNGTFWYPIPFDSYVRSIGVISQIHINNEIQSQVVSLASSIRSEPIYHELFREAWFQRNTNPRSSIITGIASVEVGLKQCIGQLIPEAQWLVNNLPSPPLTKMINEYLPKLPAKNSFNGEIKLPPKQVVDNLNKGVTIRNQIVHSGQKPPTIDTVEEILLAVRDMLWLIDFYCGYKWALAYIRSDTLLEMNVAINSEAYISISSSA